MHRITPKLILTALFYGAGVVASLAQNSVVRQIANPDHINRNPSISETGIVTWQETDPETAGGANSQIMLYKDGDVKSLSDGMTWSHSANVFPKTSGDRIVWQSTFEKVEQGDISWQLQEVPHSTNDIPELWAGYSPNLSAGAPPAQLYTNAAGLIRTNQLVSMEGGTDWNFFPGLQNWSRPTDEEGNEIIPVPSPEDPTIARRQPAGNNEIVFWDPTQGVVRVTSDTRNDLGPSMDGSLVAWQKAKGWPFGWEIMVYDGQDRYQLTTNYYYDMAPEVKDGQVVWYGWDGNDFEIFLYDHAKQETRQITDNTFDDVSPVLDKGIVAWEAYPAVEADIYLWKEGQDIIKLSENIEDDLNPRISNGQVVWQGFDGDDFEIYRYDGEKTIKLTGNNYDDLNPEISGGTIVWMGYEDNWDSEIFFWNGQDITMVTTNDYEDRDPKTAGGAIVWQADEFEKSYIYLLPAAGT